MWISSELITGRIMTTEYQQQDSIRGSQKNSPKNNVEIPSRRSILKKAAGASVLIGASSQPAAASFMRGNGFESAKTNNHPIYGGNKQRRRADAYLARTRAARNYLSNRLPAQETNGDEGRFNDFRASYSKGLPHNQRGEVRKPAYNQLLRGLESGRHADIESVPLGGQRKLANPQGAYKFEMTGLDSHATFMRPAPKFLGKETSAEMGELYWKALARDIPFDAYDSSPLISAAVSDLNAFQKTVGPKEGGQITAGTIFRGETPGDLDGPYITQFLLKDIPFGNTKIEQRYDTPAPGDDYMTDFGSWLGIQNGVAPSPLSKGNKRYINDARALGEFVHVDFSYQAYLSAALILLGIPGSIDQGNFYTGSVSQGAFTSLGGPDILDLVTKAGNLALTGAWYQKWLVHRRARPEVYGGRLHQQLTGVKNYGLKDEIIDSAAVGRTFVSKGSYFLPQAFPEGSPTHPAYPAGHATIAGACTTVLKAFFEESLPIPNPVVTDVTGSNLIPYSGTLTIGGEINKLANNIALGRDWAGVHYRSDGVDGLAVGEQQAIGMLQDYSLTYNEDFDGFNLIKFDGQSINIRNGRIF